MNVYKLTHQRHIEYKLHTGEWITDNKLIGFFDTRDNAEKAKAAISAKPGFCDFPDDFVIEEYTISEDSLSSVYLVEHSYYIIDDRIDYTAEIGVFPTEDAAMLAAKEYEKTSKIPVATHSWDEDFDIDNYLSVAKYTVGEADWQEGFTLS